MAIEADDPCLVNQPMEILSVLQGLLSQRVLVRLEIPGHDVSTISTVLEVDSKSKKILLDVAADDLVDRQLQRAGSVRLQGMLQRVLIEFYGTLSPAVQSGRPAYAMAFPEALRRVQRREYFRVDVPATSPTHCLIRDDSLPAGQARFRLADISAGGLQLIDHENIMLKTPMGTIFDDCTLEVPGTGTLEIKLRVVRSVQSQQENGKPVHYLGCRFFNMPENRQITLQQYIGSLERALLARRWAE